MNVPAPAWLYTIDVMVRAALTAATLVIAWIGWRRRRHLWLLLLVGWAIAGLFNIIGSWLWMAPAHYVLGKMLPTAFNSFLLVANLFASWISALLLSACLAALVFRELQRPTGQ